MPALLVILQPDLGTGLAITAGAVVVIFLAGLPMWWFLGAGAAVLVSAPLAFFTLLHGYQRDRVLVFDAHGRYQAALIYYDATLKTVSRPETRGRLSGIGVGIGYCGTIFAGLFMLALGVLAGAPWLVGPLCGAVIVGEPVRRYLPCGLQPNDVCCERCAVVRKGQVKP